MEKNLNDVLGNAFYAQEQEEEEKSRQIEERIKSYEGASALWKNFDFQREFYFDLENDLYDSEEMKKKVEAWTKLLKKNPVSSFGLVYLRHYGGIKSIYIDFDIRTSSKSLGPSQAIITKTYNSTHEELDAITRS